MLPLCLNKHGSLKHVVGLSRASAYAVCFTPWPVCLPVVKCAVLIQEARGLNTEVYQNPPHTDQYLLFDPHYPVEHKLGVIRILQRQETLKTHGCHNWAFVKSVKVHG